MVSSPRGSPKKPGSKARGPAGARVQGADVAGGPLAQRRTRQRDAVRKLLAELDGFRTVRQIHAALRDRGERVALTTVYRILQLLVDVEEVDVLRSDSGDGLYRLCGGTHHHHLMCRSCGRVVEVTGPTVERWAERVADEHGFTDVGHSLEIIGTCASCIAGAAPDWSADTQA